MAKASTTIPSRHNITSILILLFLSLNLHCIAAFSMTPKPLEETSERLSRWQDRVSFFICFLATKAEMMES
jgi:hypothetical protein